MIIVQDVDGDTPLIVACNMTDVDLAGRLLSAGCQVSSLVITQCQSLQVK